MSSSLDTIGEQGSYIVNPVPSADLQQIDSRPT